MRTELHVSVLTERGCGDDYVLGRTAQTHPDVMVIRVDNGRAAREIGSDGNPPRREFKLPRLRIVTVGGQCRTTHEFPQKRNRLSRFKKRAAQYACG